MKYDETLIMQDIILFLYVCGTKVKSGSITQTIMFFEIIPVDHHSLNAFSFPIKYMETKCTCKNNTGHVELAYLEYTVLFG